MSGKAYIRHILSIYSAYIGDRWKEGGREGDEREIAGLSSRASNKDKLRAFTRRSKQRKEGRDIDKDITSRYHAKKQTKRGKTAN